MMNIQQFTFPGGDGLELFATSWTPDIQPRAITVIIHGFGEHSGRYRNLVEPFVAQGLSVYSFDLRGHGLSPGQRGHINDWREYREDLGNFMGVISSQAPELPIVLYGHSMGSVILLDYIMRNHNGSQAAILSSVPIQPVGVANPALILLARFMSRLVPGFSLNLGLETKALSRDISVVKAYEQDPLVHGKSSARWGTEILKTIEWVRQHPKLIRMPVLIIHGSADRLHAVSGTKAFAEQIEYEDAEFIVYPGGYHESHNDLDHERVANDLLDWINRHLT